MPLILNGTTGVSGVDGSAGTPSYQGTDTNTGIFYPAADTIAFAEGGVEVMRIDSSGNVGIGTSSPTNYGAGTTTLSISNSSGSGYFDLYNAGSRRGYHYATASTYNISTTTSTALVLETVGSERMRIDSSGNVGIGMTPSGDSRLEVYSADSATIYKNVNTGTGTSDGFYVGMGKSSATEAYVYNRENNNLIFGTNNTERMRITSGGELLFGRTTAGDNNAGIRFTSGGLGVFTRSGADPLAVVRLDSDGDLVTFYRGPAGGTITLQGSISVSGSTVSYNAFAGSHWSQLSDGSKPDILRGTVMESINELVEWPDEPTSERLCRVKVSDTAASKKVYGVFMGWHNDWTATNDMLVTSVGAFVCRVNKDVVVQEGDLLESNGDGTARVQADDIMRSSTIGKVTCTEKTHEYDDGSYCVPTVLYCG